MDVVSHPQIDSASGRPAKKPRRTSAGKQNRGFGPAALAKHDAFKNWAVAQGIQINGVEAANLPGRGVGLLVTEKIKKDQRIIFVPEKAMIRPTPSKISQLNLKDASPQAQLAGLLNAGSECSDAYEACSQVWPTASDFQSCMLFFPSCTMSQIEPEAIPFAVKKPLERLRRDFERDAAATGVLLQWPLSLEALEEELSKAADQYRLHWTIANTRSFHWKPPGLSTGQMVICPFLDYMNHCPSGQGCEVTQSPKGYSLTADRDYEPGEEILATYGAHTNDKLLVHYGFTIPNNPDDGILLDDILLPHLSAAQKDTLRDVGYLGNYTLAPSTSEICFRTQVAVRSVLLTANEWEHYLASGEDLAENQDERVRGWLRGPLRAWVKAERAGGLIDADEMGGGEAGREECWSFGYEERDQHNRLLYKLLWDRWSQMIDGVNAWLGLPASDKTCFM